MSAPDCEDRIAILEVIEAETVAYFSKDYESWERCWLHAPHIRKWSHLGDGSTAMDEGWDQISAKMKHSMEQFPVPDLATVAKVRRERIDIRIGTNLAWATFDQHAPKTGDPLDNPGVQYQMRILERENGEWKISCAIVMQRRIDYAPGPLLQVDADATLLWMNGEAEKHFPDQQGLVVSGGRLRAPNRTSDKALRGAIRWASHISERYYRVFHQNNTVPATGLPMCGAVPVVLCDDQDVNLQICWVIVDGGIILISFHDKHMTERRLAAAETLYSLSPAQTRLAKLIIEGHDLAKAAAILDVSINTTRTHLQRMFDKTGVRSQTALVRVLLSTNSAFW